MYKISKSTIFLVGVATGLVFPGVSAHAADDSSAAQQQERQLIRVLQSDAPAAEKAITCKRLAIYGTGDAVPALAPLLADERLASWARIALEVIPDPAADTALREATGSLSGRVLIGAINSIGVRRDPLAVDALSPRLNDPDPDVASAAAIALGRIGNAPAVKLLRPALAAAPDDVRSAVAEGCILCAERFLTEGQAEEAVELYDAVRQADVPQQRVLEGTRGAILARQTDGIPLLLELLKSTNQDLYAMGLTTARELAGQGVTEALVALLGETAPDRQAALLLVLADRGDTEAVPVVLQAAWSGPKEVQIQAIQVLQRLGNASCIPTLLDIALESDEEVAEAAKRALVNLPGKAVDADLVGRLPQVQGKTRRLMIELVGERRIEALPALLEAANDENNQIRAAALLALGSVVDLDNLSILISRVVNPQYAEDREPAQRALHAASIRMPDGDACAEKLNEAIASAPTSVKVTILEILGAMGGTEAVQAVGSAAKDSNPQLQDVATRLLGQWMTVDAAPELLEVAQSPDARYQTRALRGYIRLARQFSMPDQQRADMCRAALRAAQGDEEKKLVLQVAERYPSIDMLKLALDAGRTPSLKEEAGRSARAIAQKIGGETVSADELLTLMGQDAVRVEIIRAEYGADGQSEEVTEILRKHKRDLPLIVLPSSYNASFGGDPAPGKPKQLRVWYRINGHAGEASFPENATIMLPMPQ